MKVTKEKVPSARLVSTLCSQKGLVLPLVLILIVIAAAMGSAAVVMTRADIKIAGNYKSSEEAFFIAQAGTEHARALLGTMNAGSVDKNSFSDELAGVVGANGVLDGAANGTDDAPMAATAFGTGSYTVYLTNDLADGVANQSDSNKKVTLTSIGRGSNGSKAVIEVTVATFELFPPPAPITLLGTTASFSGGSSNVKELHGDDQCGTDPVGVTRPVIAVSHDADVAAVQNSVGVSKPKTYYARNESGVTVTAADRPDLITSSISPTTFLSIKTDYGIDLLNATDLNNLVNYLKKVAHTVAPGGSSGSSVNVGTPSAPRIVVVTGDFSLNGNGAGILVVTGKLVYNGDVNYDGLILAIGEGYMKRSGAGNGTINGAIVVAHTLGPDGTAGTADDALGSPTFDTSGAGTSNLSYCSSAINQALSVIGPRPVAFKHIL